MKITVSVLPAPTDATATGIEEWFAAADAISTWAERSLFAQTVTMLNAQLQVLACDIGSHFFFDEDGVHELRNHEAVLDFLEQSSSDQFAEVFTAPDIVAGIASIQQEGSREQKYRLAKILQQRTPAPPAGRPRKPARKRVDVQVAERVVAVGRRLFSAFEYVKERRKMGGNAAGAERVAREVVQRCGIEPRHARCLASSKTLRAAVCAIVAADMKKTQKAISTAAQRGVNHPDFSPPA